jgi:beta-xylosidase
MSIRRQRLLASAVCALAMTFLAVGQPGPATAYSFRPSPVGSDSFGVGRSYRGDFPDPSVLRVGRFWFAYSTTMSGLNLPVLKSADLVHWEATGEGLKKPARWAARHQGGKYPHVTTWAPSVARIGNRFVHYYATHVRGTKHRMCISVSRSKFPGKGFVDRTAHPLVCPPDRGAIDPSYFMAPGGKRFLVWKGEQNHTNPARIWITPLSADGVHLIGSSRRLLQVQDPWEGGIIENPSMIGYKGRFYLFYSGGSYANATYATGYAICQTYLGPCTRASAAPLLATGGRVSGTGGAMAFYDSAMHLRLAYAAWDYGHTGYPKSSSCRRAAGGCPQRKLHIATLGSSTDPAAPAGTLRVTDRG